LHIAVFQGILDVVRSLITEFGADVNQAMHDGATPLTIAAEMGYLDIVRCLAGEFSADVNQANRDGWTASYHAAYNGHLDTLRCLVCEFGAAVNQANTNGATPLIIAAQEGNLKMVRCLIMELGADINQADRYGQTPLMLAANTNNQPLLKHLVHKGAHVRAASMTGKTATTMLAAAGATVAQVAYLQVRECCANPGCDGGGRKRCCVCKATRYCGMVCRVAHWRVHRLGCRPPTDAASEGSEVVS
jgi:ankyrin repeat protein